MSCLSIPLCFLRSKPWQFPKAGGFLCIWGGQQQWEFVPRAAPQWWITGIGMPFIWCCWQGSLLIITWTYQLTRGKNKKPCFLYVNLIILYTCQKALLCTFCLLVVTEWTAPLTGRISWTGDTLLHTKPAASTAAVIFTLLTLLQWSSFVTVTKFLVPYARKGPFIVVSKMFSR